MDVKTKGRMLMMGVQQGGLPSEYQEVEWIGSASTALKSNYINTNFNPTSNTKIIVVLKRDYGENYSRAFGVGAQEQQESPIYYILLWFDRSVCSYFALNENSGGTSFNLQLGIQHTIEYYNNSLYVDNVKVVTKSGGVWSSPYPLYLFSSNDYFTNQDSIITMYSCKIYENEVIQRDFIPCYRKSNGEIGMYDLVNGVFYANQGTVSFIKGPDVN